MRYCLCQYSVGLAFLTLCLGTPVRAATAGLALLPGRLEVEVKPGVQKTVSFQIESPPSDEPVQGRLLLNLTDWSLSEEGSMGFQDAGSGPMSAASWITFSPTAISISSGQRSLVRVTIDTPADLKPGVYRAGIFVQERPPAAAPQKGDHNILFRFRYMEVLYVIVQPAAADPHLVDAGLQAAGKGFDLIYKMTNDGSAFVRPFLSFNLKDAAGKVVREEKAHETTILLPGAKLAERIPLDGVPPGKYQLSVAVDFRDDKPIQSMVRTIDVAPEAPAVAAAAPAQPKQ
jgi:hypothetical protein